MSEATGELFTEYDKLSKEFENGLETGTIDKKPTATLLNQLKEFGNKIKAAGGGVLDGYSSKK